MLGTLLESRARSRRPIAGAVVSVCAHSLFIGAAVYATAHARVTPPVFHTVRPVFFVRRDVPATVPVGRSAADAPRARERRALEFFNVPTIDVRVPALDMSAATTKPDDFAAGGNGLGEVSDSRSAPSYGSRVAFRADEVEKQVAPMPGNPPPAYPAVLQMAGVEGKVIAMFVVNEAGRTEDTTVRFVSSDNHLFEDAVKVALRRMRFMPAEVDGRKVRQLVQMPFVFTIRK